MSLAIAFWCLYLVSLVFSVWSNYSNPKVWGGGLLVFVLVGILGWQVFGAAIHR